MQDWSSMMLLLVRSWISFRTACVSGTIAHLKRAQAFKAKSWVCRESVRYSPKVLQDQEVFMLLDALKSRIQMGPG